MESRKSLSPLPFSQARLGLIMAVAIFLVELSILLVRPASHTLLVALLEATAISGVLALSVWLFFLRPLHRAASRERANAEEARSRADQDWEATFDTIGDMITIHDNDYNIIRANRAAVERLGLPGRYPVAAKCFRYFHGTDGPLGVCPSCASLRTGAEVCTEVFEPSLNMYVETRSIPRFGESGRPIGTIHVVRDITRRKQLELSLEQQKSFAEQLLQNLAVATFVLDPEHRVVLWNRACEELSGLPAERMLGTSDQWKAFYESRRPTLADVVINRDYDQLPSLYSRFSRSTLIDKGLHAEGWYLNLNGRNRYVVFDAAPIHDRDGKLLFVVETLQDIPERKRIEDELARSEAKLRTIIEAETECVKLVAHDGTLLEMNPAGLRMIGADSPDQVVGRSLYPLIGAEHRERVRALTESVFQGNEEELTFELVDFRGGRKWVETKAVPLRNERGEIVALLGVTRDISERRRLEEQLQHAQKMEALGTLTGGIAHDFNNILTSIIGYAELLALSLPPEDPASDYAAQVLVSSERAAKLTQNLLAFSRKQVSRLEPANLNDIISGMQGLLARLLREQFRLVTELASGTLNAMVDRGQIEQVIMNLVVNARDAMPGGGEILIATGLVEMTDSFIKRRGFGRPGTYVHVAVADAGEGMTSATRQRIFEPFYTTKEVGKGTGLGLSIVYGIVEQHRGYIDCRSEPGLGTVFHLYVPFVDRTAVAATAIDQLLPRGMETVLVVEDEETVQTIARIMLESLGYRVVIAVDGKTAIDLLQEHNGTIGLAILDVIMPGMNGCQVWEQMRKARPGIKALFMSGYTADVISGKGLLTEGMPVIAKPFSLRELAMNVRRVLDGTAGAQAPASP